MRETDYYLLYEKRGYFLLYIYIYIIHVCTITARFLFNKKEMSLQEYYKIFKRLCLAECFFFSSIKSLICFVERFIISTFLLHVLRRMHNFSFLQYFITNTSMKINDKIYILYRDKKI